MSKHNRTKRKFTKAKLLIAGSLLFAFGVTTSAVVTSAWYSLFEVATVGDLNLQIGNNFGGLELHLLNNGQDYYHEDGSGFTKEELGIEGKVLGEVSGMFEEDWYNESTINNKDLLPLFHSRYKPGSSRTNPGIANRDEEGSFYVQNEFYFYADQSNVELFLDVSSSITANVEANKATAERKGYDADRAMALNDVVHAVRVSILTDEGYIIIDPGESGPTYYGGILDLNKDGYYDFNEDQREILYGQYSGEVKYLPGEEEPTIPLDDNRNTFVANHKQGIEKVDLNSPSLLIKQEEKIKIDTLRYDFENDPLKPVPPICHVKAGERKRMIISIYVEGWDLHMTDDIASASFDVNIAFNGLIKNN